MYAYSGDIDPQIRDIDPLISEGLFNDLKRVKIWMIFVVILLLNRFGLYVRLIGPGRHPPTLVHR